MFAAAAGASDIQTDGQLISSAAVGTPPLAVTSTTRVDNLNAQYLDGWGAESFLRPLDNVITVSPSGGDFTSIQAAIDSIADAYDGNRYTVLVGPGSYNEFVTLKSFVDVIGAGRRVTTIWAGGSDIFAFSATVVGADDALLRGFFVSSNAESERAYATGVLASPGKPWIEDVWVFASGATTSSTGIYNSGDGTLEVRNARIDGVGAVDAFGVYNLGSHVDLELSSVFGYLGSNTSYGVFNTGPPVGQVRLLHSYVTGDTAYVGSDYSSAINVLRYTQVDSTSIATAGGTDQCFFVHDGTTAYTSTCP